MKTSRYSDSQILCILKQAENGADCSLPSECVIRVLEQGMEWRGKPKANRCLISSLLVVNVGC
jgi:hypothetical protein